MLRLGSGVNAPCTAWMLLHEHFVCCRQEQLPNTACACGIATAKTNVIILSLILKPFILFLLFWALLLFSSQKSLSRHWPVWSQLGSEPTWISTTAELQNHGWGMSRSWMFPQLKLLSLSPQPCIFDLTLQLRELSMLWDLGHFHLACQGHAKAAQTHSIFRQWNTSAIPSSAQGTLPKPVWQFNTLPGLRHTAGAVCSVPRGKPVIRSRGSHTFLLPALVSCNVDTAWGAENENVLVSNPAESLEPEAERAAAPTPVNHTHVHNRRQLTSFQHLY